MVKEKEVVIELSTEEKLAKIADSIRSTVKDKSAIMIFGKQENLGAVEFIPTGSLLLDNILGGGIPKGKVTELYGNPGGGKCLKKDVVVSLEGLGSVCIGSLVSKEMHPDELTPLSVNILSETGVEGTSHLYCGGEQNTVKIVTRCGYSLEGTETHRIKVMDESGEIVWKALQDLKKGDHCVIKKGLEFGSCTDLSGFKFVPKKNDYSYRDCAVPMQLTKELTRVLGYLVAEGTVTYPRGFLFSNYNDEVIADYSYCIHKSFGLDFTRGSNKKRSWQISSVKARKFLGYCGLTYTKSSEKEVPCCIMSSPKEYVKEFLRAYWEGDGGRWTSSSIGCTSASEKLIDQIHLLLLAFGVISRKKVIRCKANNAPNPTYRNYYVLVISGEALRVFRDKIGFITSTKNNFLEEACSVKCNPNIGCIPNMKSTIKEFRRAICTTLGTGRGGPQYKGKGKKSLLGETLANKNACRTGSVSYELLGQLLNKTAIVIGSTLVFQKLKQLHESNYFYDPVIKISHSSGEVYDLTVPGSHSYVSNGFISHNSSIALSTLAQAQKLGLLCGYIDSESALIEDWIIKLGVDTQLLLFSQENCTEEVFTLLELMLDNGVQFIVLDSVASLVSRAEIEGDFGDHHMGVQARLMGQAMRKLCGKISRLGATVVFINQIREQIGIMFGNPETTPGGKALKFWATVRLEVKQGTLIRKDEKSDPIGIKMRAYTAKNKVYPPLKRTEVDFYFDRGFDNQTALFELALGSSVFEKHGSYYRWPAYDDENRYRETWVSLLQDVTVFAKLKEQVFKFPVEKIVRTPIQVGDVNDVEEE